MVGIFIFIVLTLLKDLDVLCCRVFLKTLTTIVNHIYLKNRIKFEFIDYLFVHVNVVVVMKRSMGVKYERINV